MSTQTIKDPNDSGQVMLSTIDNPFNPFEDFKKWFVYDEVVGCHHSCSLLLITIFNTSILVVWRLILP